MLETLLTCYESAHIQPYLGPRSNHVQNGVLLTKELHALFDAGYVTIASGVSAASVCAAPPARSVSSADERATGTVASRVFSRGAAWSRSR